MCGKKWIIATWRESTVSLKPLILSGLARTDSKSWIKSRFKRGKLFEMSVKNEELNHLHKNRRSYENNWWCLQGSAGREEKIKRNHRNVTVDREVKNKSLHQHKQKWRIWGKLDINIKVKKDTQRKGAFESNDEYHNCSNALDTSCAVPQDSS